MTNRAEETEREWMTIYAARGPTIADSFPSVCSDPDLREDLYPASRHEHETYLPASSIQEVVDDLERKSGRYCEEAERLAKEKASTVAVTWAHALATQRAADLLRERCLGGEEG